MRILINVKNRKFNELSKLKRNVKKKRQIKLNQ